MRLPDPAIEEEHERIIAAKSARCFDCRKFKPIPSQHGDPMYGFCTEECGYKSGADKVQDLECEDFEWRRWW